jgi:hypothetical protein
MTWHPPETGEPLTTFDRMMQLLPLIIFFGVCEHFSGLGA